MRFGRQRPWKTWEKQSQRRRNARRQSAGLRKIYKQLGKKRSERQRRGERYTQMNADFQRTARRENEGLLRRTMQINRGKQ